MTSTIKVNTITTESGSTLTVGGCGKTVALASGASQTGFGRTGAVNWQTTKKTAGFTAKSGEGYFCDTSGGAFTLTLPSSPSAGDIVGLKDYASTFNTQNLTIGRGGSNLNGSAQDKVLTTANLSLTLVYVDATEGWISVEEGTGFVGESFIVASGGAITESGDCKIHTFTGPGNFVVCSLAGSPANNQVSYMVVAGGGGGGSDRGGGGGAGGFREDKSPVTPYTASPLDGAGNITVTATSFPIVVGGGGAKGTNPTPVTGTTGSASSFSTITSAGGGGGGGAPASPSAAGLSGGSGGGASAYGPTPTSTGGTGNTPPVSPPQGNNGGPATYSPYRPGGGGGGATAAGTAGACTSGGDGVAGGAGATTGINGSNTAFAGGGGGGSSGCCSGGGSGGTGGAGGGGAGGASPGGGEGTAGSTNTGGGGGGGGNLPNAAPAGRGGNGGSGIVIIRYKFQ